MSNILIFLHGQYASGEEYEDYTYPNLDIICPSAKNTSWIKYNYFNIPLQSSINNISKSIFKIVHKQVLKVGNPKKVFLGGSSQGSSLAMHVYALYGTLCNELGGFIGCRSEQLYSHTNVTSLKTSTSPIYFFSGMKDKWHASDTPKHVIKKCKKNYVTFLQKQNPTLNIHLFMIENANHNDIGNDEYIFFNRFFNKILK